MSNDAWRFNTNRRGLSGGAARWRTLASGPLNTGDFSGGSKKNENEMSDERRDVVSDQTMGASCNLRGDKCRSQRGNMIPFSIDSPRAGRSPLVSTPVTPTSLGTPPATEEHRDAFPVGAVGLQPYLAGEMPRGRFIMVNLLSTWGDAHEIGLNGIEIFNDRGERVIPTPGCAAHRMDPGQQRTRPKEDVVTPREKRVTADGCTSRSYATPNSDLLVIVEYPVETGGGSGAVTAGKGDAGDCAVVAGEEDTRYKVANLVNGCHNTHDDSRLFTMPFSSKGHHLICFVLPQSVVVSMVRVYNYSGRGRVHTGKGVRELEITVDDQLVFRGEIVQNSGDVVHPQRVGLENCENILFTENLDVLRHLLSIPQAEASVPSESLLKQSRLSVEESTHRSVGQTTSTAATKRASTTTVLFSNDAEDKAQQIGSERSVLVPAAVSVDAVESELSLCSDAASAAAPTAVTVPWSGGGRCLPTTTQNRCSKCPTNVTSLCLFLLGTWGDTQNIGLSGLRLRDAGGDIVSQHIAHWYVRLPSQEQGEKKTHAWEDQLIYLFDESAETALTLPCERGVEVIFVFDAPLPTLGFVEVANYLLGEHTFSGVKEARLFLSSATTFWSPAALVAAYAALWSPDVVSARATLAAHNIFEVTPEEGVILRKAPAFLSVPRFQVYDLSLSAGLCRGAAPGSSLSHSLAASMTIRAEMALRRARMALMPRPEWLLEYQPYITPLLPVAYVLKISLVISARSAARLKKYAKKWMLEPLRGITIVNENGKRIHARCARSGSRGSTADEVSHDFVTECLFTPLPGTIQEDAEAAAVAARMGIHTSLLQASISLVYVADSPFCVSLLRLNHPLAEEEDGCAAWVRQICVLMDDALVFDSGDVGGDPTKRSAASATADSAAFRTRGKSVVFFTLDAAVLEETRRGVVEATNTHERGGQ